MSRPPTFLVFYELLILSLLSLLTGHGPNRRNLIRLSAARYLLALLLPKMHNRCCCFNDIGRYFSKPGMKLITFPLYLHGPTCIYSKHKRSWKCILDQHHNFISLQNLEIWNIYSLFTFVSCLGDEETCVKHELRALDFQDCNHKLYVLSVGSKMKITCYNLTNFSGDFGIRKLLVKLHWFHYLAYDRCRLTNFMKRREALEVLWIQLYSCVDNNATFNSRFSNNTLFGKSVLMIWSLMNTYSSGSGATICTMNIVA